MTFPPRLPPGRVAYLPSIDRPSVRWPDDAKVALWIAPNVEHYEYLPPHDPLRNPWPRSPHPDVPGYAYRDYGNRVGFWRMLEVFDRFDVRATASTSLAVFDHYPEIAEAMTSRGWEIMSHGIYNTRYLSGLDEADERAFYADCVETLRRHTGAQLRGMLGPAISNTVRTPDLMADAGLTYHADWFHDDQPVPIEVSGGRRLVSVPYTMELNDVPVFMHHYDASEFVAMAKAQLDTLWAEAAADGSGRVMCVALHPYLMGMPHRADALAEMLEYLVGHDGVWQATAAEIADWFVEHHYDEFVEHAARLAPDETADGAGGASAADANPAGAAPAASAPAASGFGPATRTHGMDHPHYRWSPLPSRPALRWPGDAALAVGAVVLLEHFEWSPPPDAFSLRRRSGGLGRLPAPDYAQLTHREYGHRVGVFRLLDILERHGITPTVAVDALTARHYPWLVDHCVGRGCEIVAHGVSATRLATSNLTVDAERDLIAESLAAVEAATGAGARGWYSAEGVESHRTPQLLAAAGVDYLLDWPNDEQPYPITTPAGEMVSLPMFLEADDEFALWHRRATLAGWADTVTAAAARMCHDGAHHRAGGRLLLLCLRPWLTGQPFRAPTLDRALATGIAPLLESGRAFAATTSEIADAYALSVGTVDVGADGQQE